MKAPFLAKNGQSNCPGKLVLLSEVRGLCPTDIRDTGCTDIGVFVWCIHNMKGKSLASRSLVRMQAAIRALWKSPAFGFVAHLV